MKAVQLPGAGEKWAINLEYNPWDPCGAKVYRIDGTTQYYDTEDEANAAIKRLLARGEQGMLDKHSKPLDPVQPGIPPKAPRKVTDTTRRKKCE
jgi:hypothetical protein